MGEDRFIAEKLSFSGEGKNTPKQNINNVQKIYINNKIANICFYHYIYEIISQNVKKKSKNLIKNVTFFSLL